MVALKRRKNLGDLTWNGPSVDLLPWSTFGVRWF